MSGDIELDVRLFKRRRIARWFGMPAFRLEIHLTPQLEVGAEGDTAQAAWEAASLAAKIFHGTTITSECPFDTNGEPLP